MDYICIHLDTVALLFSRSQGYFHTVFFFLVLRVSGSPFLLGFLWYRMNAVEEEWIVGAVSYFGS